jgi:ATP-dependent RNA helicase DeaD
VLAGITEIGFEHPTTIQAKLIPPILSGRDVLGQAKTGTGKTASFALPMLSVLKPGEAMSGLVLVPTRELALQVAADYRELGRHTGLRVVAVYGGQSINSQAEALRKGAEIIVATPGRIMDMVQRGHVRYSGIKMVVLDEVDRMLDIGFRDDIRRILGSCPKDRQTVFVSATLQPEVEALARGYARDCEKVVATSGALTVALVKQLYLSVAPWDKKALLKHLLTHEQPALTVVFCRTKKTVDNLTEYLNRGGIEAHAIHGDMYQAKRNKVIEQLRGGKLSVLIASDLASRGLDVEGITHVINYDLPEDPDLYVHRIGRTARAGRDGIAWSLVTPEQGELLTQIELLINAEIPKMDYPDFVPGPVPRDIAASKELSAKKVEVARSFNRFAAVLPPGAVGHVASSTPADADPSKFPGGIVPSKLPPRVMQGRVRTRGAHKQAIAQTLKPDLAAPGVVPPAGGGKRDGEE